MSLLTALITCAIYKWIIDKYRYLYLVILIPCILVIITWIWKNNQIGLSWWCNQITSTILVFVYVVIFCHFGWRMIDITFHSFVFSSIVQHMLIPFVDDDVIYLMSGVTKQLTGFYRWWSTYWWVMFRDGPLVFAALIGVIALIYCLSREIELSDSTLYVSINEPFSSISPQRLISRRRRGARTFPKFRCTLVRFVVFGRIYNRRWRYDCHRYPYRY